MPQEPSCVGGYAAHPANKNAKDKSNCASLLSRKKVHIEQVTNGRNSRCSSEKDSGYSDAGSDYQQTDVDDQRSTVTKSKGHKSQSAVNQGNRILVPGQSEFTPMFIIKNLFLKQSGQSGQDQSLHSLWGSEGTNAQSNVLLLQQPGITVSPLHVLTPPLRRADGKNKKNKSTYLPILSSYPRIAPNLNKKKTEKLPASREGTSEEHSPSKRACTEETKEEVSISTQGPETQHPNKQLERRSLSHCRSFIPSLSSCNDAEQKSSCLLSTPPKIMGSSAGMGPSSAAPIPKSLPFPSSYSEPTSLLLPTSKVSCSAGSDPDSNTDLTRHRRFLNTVEILSQSGLLDITLRTQELLQQSAATEQNITQLRQHTHLLCQAVQAGSTVPTLEKIHRTMVESGCYPNLRSLLFSDDRALEPDSSSKINPMDTFSCGFNGQGEVLTTEPVRESRHFSSVDKQDLAFGR